MILHPAGSTVHHTPDPEPDGTRTKPYDGTVNGTGLNFRITYIVEGSPVHRDYDPDPAVNRYEGSTAGVWRREYDEASPPTVPPSGTYRVYDTGTLRETGTWRR